MRLLSRRALTVAELRRRLERRGFSPAAVDGAVAYCAEYGWLDDRAYARRYVAARGSGPEARGPRRLRVELLRRGVPRAIVDEVLAECSPEGGWGSRGAAATGGAAQEQVAEALVRGRLHRLGALDRRTAWRRLWGFLIRRRFEPEVATGVLFRVLGDAGPETGEWSDGDGIPVGE